MSTRRLPTSHCRSIWGEERKYHLLEDNDPANYNSNMAKILKAEKEIKAHVFPLYSLDINPLNFCFWKPVEATVLAECPARVGAAAKYKARLRETALALPKGVVTKAVGRTAGRVRMLKGGKGGNILRD